MHAVLIFIIFTFATGIILIMQLQSKIASTNAANIKLLDGMHEGVLILSKTSKEIFYKNKPAQELLSHFMAD